MNIRYLCENCREEMYIWEGISCTCEGYGILQENQCPTCWEWRDHTMFEDQIACCDYCRFQAKTMIRLGILSIEETVLETFYETVRMRNATLHKDAPISNIELKKGKIIGEIVSDCLAPVVWQEDIKEWEVVDDFVVHELMCQEET